MKYKTCTKCHKRKPVSEFVIDKRIKGNYTSWCKKCISIYQKKYREINKKRIKELNKMHEELTSPIKRQEAQRRTRIEKMLSDKRKDTGYA